MSFPLFERRVGQRLGLFTGLLLTAALLSTAPLVAQDAQQAVAQHLQAGEFAPAIATANGFAGPVRDRLLGQIAGAQARAGMRGGAFSTAAQISGDLARGQSIGAVANTPLGNFGQFGGGSMADFDSLIELIISTVEPESWDETGGPGSISEFEGGVRVDAGGLVHSLIQEDVTGQLVRLRRRSGKVSLDADVRRSSPLRKVSLTRLERHVQLKLAAGEPLDEDMLVLAGLQKIQYVMVYPETGDLVLAGPAGDWQADDEGRLVGVDSHRPVLRLDDLVVILRHMMKNYKAPFGCSITPIKEHLARTQAFLTESAKKPLRTGQRRKWLSNLRDEMGRQRVEYYGIDPQTRVARVMFEADYRMKLVGIGLEKGTTDVPSYLASVDVPRGQAPPPMGVLRWWFTLNYDAIMATPDRDAFEIRGQGVKVLSENERLTQQGERIHTGRSDALTAQFAQRFTKHFTSLAAKYPVYADMQNLFDMALACSLIAAEDMPSQVDWHMTCFGDPQQYQVELGHAPEMVETVINHRVIHRVHILAAASGGVRIDPGKLVARRAIEVDRGGALGSRRHLAAPEKLPPAAWWWD